MRNSYVVQIKGCNGSGKSTIPKQMVAQSDDVEFDGTNTVLHDMGWVLIGPYDPDKLTAVGCDKIGKVAAVKDAILNAIGKYPLYDILFEGMMISTIKSTFYDFLMELHTSAGIEPMFVILKATPDGCLERLSARGTRKKKLKIDNIINKCELVMRHAKTYPAWCTRYIDIEDTPIDGMLDAFLDLVVPTYMPKSPYEYRGIVVMKDEDVIDKLDSLGWPGVSTVKKAKMDAGQRRRYLGTLLLPPREHVRDDCLEPDFYAPSTFMATGVRDYSQWIGYRTATGNDMSLLVNMHEMRRCDIPLLTEWEQVSLCGDCGGSRGCCPGYARRFHGIMYNVRTAYILTVTMDMKWALKYGSHNNIYMPLTYADMVTVSYIRRMVQAIKPYAKYVLGAGSCPGKCRPCTVMLGRPCTKPMQRQYSAEAVGIDCDELHAMLYGEYMPWAYKGHWVIPTYMTRYACILSDRPLANILHKAVIEDKSYTTTFADSPGGYDVRLFEIPSGCHKGCHQYVYSMEDDR